MTITNPMMILENLESEVYAYLKEEKGRAEINLAANVVEKMTPRIREDDLGAKPKNFVTKNFVTVTKPGILKMPKNELVKPSFRSSKIPTS